MATRVDRTASMMCRRSGCSSEKLAARVIEADARFDEWSKLAVSLQVRVSELEAALREIHANYCMADNIERIAREALASKGKDADE